MPSVTAAPSETTATASGPATLSGRGGLEELLLKLDLRKKLPIFVKSLESKLKYVPKPLQFDEDLGREIVAKF